MKIIPAKTPGFIKTLFPNFVWNINTKDKEIYLTFDDGPTPEVTPWVLQILKDYNAKATFFCIGNNVISYPEIFQNILDGGHTYGNHTHSHLKGWKTKTKIYLDDIKKCEDILSSKIQNSEFRIQKLYRPPYGKFKTKQSKSLQKMGYTIILWDVLSYDWDISVSEERCLNNVISTAKEGSIVVLHDSVKAYKNLNYVLPKILEYYTNKGFEFKALTTHTLV